MLLTPGPRNGTSGGHRYNDHLLAGASERGFDMRTTPASIRRLPQEPVVIVDSLDAWKVAAAVRRRRRSRLVALVHQPPGGVDGPRWIRRVRRLLDLATYRRCDRVIVAGRAVADMLRHEGIDADRLELIAPGSDLPPFEPRQPLRAGRRIGVLNVANWLPNKGIIELVEAVSSLPDEDVTLHLVGQTDNDPRYRAVVTERLQQADMVERAVLHGPLEPAAVASLYAAADVFVFPSSAEAYGTVVAEALAMGLPVVGWRVPYMSALADDHIEALLVPIGDIDGLRDAIHQIAVDAGLREALSEGARRRGAALPTWEQTRDRFFDALDLVLAGVNT